MQLKSILNHVERHKSFIFQDPRWSKDKQRIEVPIKPRKNSQAICSRCFKKRPGYDRLSEREFEHVPLWGIPVFFLYALRRVQCPKCGVTVESVPWGIGKHAMTRSFIIFLACWSKRLSWSEVATVFGTNWHRVFDAVKWVVEFGLTHREISGVKAIGVDEIQYGKGHQYLTLVYQIENDAKRLLYVGVDRSAKTLLRFFHDCGAQWCSEIQFVCSDMWKPYLKVLGFFKKKYLVCFNTSSYPCLSICRASQARISFSLLFKFATT